MSSLGRTVAEAMGNAAHGAVLGKVLGDARDNLSEANRLANAWCNHAKELELIVDVLKVQLSASQNARTDLAQRLAAVQKELAEFNGMGRNIIDKKNRQLSDNIKYGKEVKARLYQMEKALQHSSADKASMKFMLQIYSQLVAKIGEDGSMPLEHQKKAEEVWTTFMSGGKLTEDQAVQGIIDEAPMPEKNSQIFI